MTLVNQNHGSASESELMVELVEYDKIELAVPRCSDCTHYLEKYCTQTMLKK